MSIVDLERNSIPIDLRVKIEHVMHDENLSWKDALVFLASKVVSPIGASRTRRAFFGREVVSPILRATQQQAWALWRLGGALWRPARRPAGARARRGRFEILPQGNRNTASPSGGALVQARRRGRPARETKPGHLLKSRNRTGETTT